MNGVILYAREPNNIDNTEIVCLFANRIFATIDNRTKELKGFHDSKDPDARWPQRYYHSDLKLDGYLCLKTAIPYEYFNETLDKILKQKPISAHQRVLNFAEQYFGKQNMFFEKSYKIMLGVEIKKEYCFDFGNDKNLVICKAGTWDANINLIIKRWNEAMFYFNVAPKHYKKIFFTMMDFSQKNVKPFWNTIWKTIINLYLKTLFFMIILKMVGIVKYINLTE
jgi:hypothetical protein